MTATQYFPPASNMTVRPSRILRIVPQRLGRHLFRAIPLTLVLTLVAVLYGVNLHGYPEFINDDEGTYFAQAWSVANQGVMAHYTYWYDHPPVGWMQLAVLLTPLQWIWGGDGIPVETAGRGMMTLIAVTSAALIYRIARNIGLPKLIALVAPLVWAFCPVTIYFGRQIFLDNIAMVWLLASFALVTGKPKLHLHVVAGAAFGMAVLSKETAAAALPALLLALWVFSWARTRAFSFVGFLGTGAFLVIGWVLFAIIKNELLPGTGHVSLWEAVEWQLHGRGGGASMFADGSEANNKLREWLRHDPYLVLAGTLLSFVGLFCRKLRGIALVPVVYLMVTLRGGYIPAMYVVTPLPFFALVVVYLTWQLWQVAGFRSQGAFKWPGRAVIAILVAISVVAITPSWAARSGRALTENHNVPYQQALAYVDANLPRDTTVLTDDNAWNGLVKMGWSSDGWSGPLWHYKLDRDPVAQAEHLPGGWRDVDYVLLARGMEDLVGGDILSKENSPLVHEALSHSELVKAWGPVGSQVRLLKVNPDMEPVDPKWMRLNPDQAPKATISP